MADTLAPTLHDIALGFARLPTERRRAFLDALRTRGIAFSRLPVPRRDDPSAPAPASPAQRRLWTLHRLDPASAAYHMPGVFRLRGALDAAALETALNAVAERHDILRTVYREDGDGRLWTVTLPTRPFRLGRHDLSDRPGDAQSLAEQLAAAPFDLERAEPWRADLLRIAPDDHWLVVTLHHIAADGASIGLLMADVAAAYRAARQGRPHDLPRLPAQYADIAVWQAAWLDAGEAERQSAFWRDTLAGAPARLSLPGSEGDGRAEGGGECGEQTAVLSPELCDRLKGLAGGEGCTPFVLLLAAYALLLGRMSGQDDLIVGIPVAGRRQPEAERPIGCFVNTLPLRLRIMPSLPFRQWLGVVAQLVADAQDKQDLPLDAILEAGQPEQGAGPPVQVMFDHRPDPTIFGGLDGLEVEPLELPVRTAKFDLALAGSERPDGSVLVRLAHRSAVGPAARLLRRWQRLLAQVAADPDRSLRAFDARSEEEIRAVSSWSRDPGWTGAAHDPVPVLLARLAAERPDAPAVLFGDGVLSRGELDRCANRLANRLIALGAGPERRIGVCLPRSPELIVAFLAVLKSGAAFVPLDPGHPADRQHAIREAAGLSLLIAATPLDGVTTVSPQDAAGEPDHAPAVAIHPRSLAYVIHTSGSTGAPKGVAVEHGPLAMHCVATAAIYDMGPDSRELHFLSFTFDGAHERWMTALTAGGAILLRDDSLWTAEQTYDAIRRHRLTHAGFPPKYLQQLASWAEQQGGEPPPVQLYSFGGEAMPRAGLERLFRSLRPRHAINGYGPTETVVTPLVWKGDGGSLPDSPYVPIGRPVGDRSAHILDDDLNPLPISVTGELWIGGGGLARGYLGRPAATAERFIPDPFGGPGTRLYRTGDLARWREDGTVEFLGRRDHQVKLRGFRIELGEIEAHLAAEPGVREAVVIAQETGGVTRLVGYLVPAAGHRPDPAAVTAALAGRLPAHMVPARLMVLDAIPVTPTGKLDRAALPAPRWETDAQAAPSTPVEELLASLWRDALNAERVGVTDNFFEIGGDSIIALQIVARARAAGLRITPKQLLERQTIAALAVVAEEAAPTMAVAEPPAGPSPLAPIQSWFFDQPIPNRNRWNQSVLLAATTPVDPERLAAALAMVAGRHAALRLRFSQDPDGCWTQTHADGPAAIPLEEATAADDAAVSRLCDELQGALDLARGPLMRALLIRKPDGGQRLFLVAHHLVVDGVSWRILLEELAAALQGPCVLDRLPAAGTPFALWTRRLADAVPDFLAQLDHWRAALDTPPLPTIGQLSLNTRHHAITHSLRLDRQETHRLLTEAPAAYRTRIDTLLLTAVALAAIRRFGRDALTVHVEGHGRDALFPDIDIGRTVGWFTSVYPVRLAPPASFDGAIRHVKEALRAVPDGGVGFNLLRHLGPPEARAALSGAPTAISFNYLGRFDGADDAPWRPAPEECGAGTDPDAPLGALISIDGQVMAGELVLHARASRALFPDGMIAGLMEDVRATLAELIAHCAGVETGQATPSDFPLVTLSQPQIDALPVPAPAIADILPLTPMQAAMLHHGLSNPRSQAYTVQVWAVIDGLDFDRLAAVWRTVIARHDVLRGALLRDGVDEPVMVVRKTAELPFTLLDWRGDPESDASWQHLCDDEYRRGFDFAEAPLMRVVLARTGPSTHRFLWTWHHALLDGWSMSRLLGEILRLYDGETVPPPEVQVRDLVAWTRERSRAQDRAAAHAHWQACLAALPAPTRLTAILPPPEEPEPDGAEERIIDEAAVQQLQRFASARKVTLNTLIQAGWLRLLARLCGQGTVAFGAVMSGRSVEMPGIDQVTGLLVGVLPLVHKVIEAGTHEDDRESDWLRGLLAANITARQHEHAPPPALQCWIDPASAPFDSIMIFENYPVDDALRQSERATLSFRDVGNRGRMSYPLTLVVVPRDTLVLRLEYAGALFRPCDAAALVDGLVREVGNLALSDLAPCLD
ncbi:non-ribosomal peptide synthase domain TIGR01720/amino acid adenylation domain-containing protein [Azospirillum oryzae]|uniref:Non-ribosomal peptide synthase domain TIGR01720/amino acid adenylation domain-containing protein n=1 Tax=Azospirillum oryzae TaxID=286727 RepID=A0A1X7HNC4_9PROT|nr:non-ribosomal peptide synthetase [Azospirillum oryzae]SMF89024.1 non-ribosomal peptide synthase domain TIGR01720/amino acid adenylation domain-containing protein [Azospirillum oryzae]